jgi:tetratricopeptide (TPR) repeat protein
MLSFCTIVKNEAANLPRCLASVKPYVDEMVIIDTGSTDDTVSIAQQYGAKIGHFEWCNDFAAARNYALSMVVGDWILTLDADEELVVQSKQALSDAIQEGLAYALVRREHDIPDTGLTSIRLFRNLPDLEYRYPYHELLFYKGHPLEHYQPQILEGIEIRHYGYGDASLVQKSIDRIPMLEHLRATVGLNFMLLWTLAGMYKATQELDKEQDCYLEASERLLPHLLTGDPPEDIRAVASWLYSLAVQSLQAEDIENSLFLCEQGMAWFPDFPPLFYLSGFILKITGNTSDAIPYFEHCLDVGKTEHYSTAEPFDQALITVYPAFELGTSYLELNQVEKAIVAFKQALAFDPNYAPAREQLALLSES